MENEANNGPVDSELARRSEVIVIVDEDDNPIGAKERSELEPSDIYRAASLWIFNPEGEILIARRSLKKSKNAGKWGPTVAGTVGADESYQSCVERESQEELGLSGLSLQEGPKFFVTTDGIRRFNQLYLTVLNLQPEEFDFDIEEVSEVRWVTREWLEEAAQKHPEIFTPSIVLGLEHLMPKPEDS